MPATDSERLAAVHGFLLRYAADTDAGQVHDLAHYQAMHPGYEADVAAEYLRLVAGTATAAGGEAGPLALQQLGPYRITRELGIGGQAVVYEAEDERLGRTVALKVYAARNADPRLRARLEREAKAAARIQHDHVCTVFEADERDGLLFLAMEYVPGQSLGQWIVEQRSQPTCKASERIARAVAWFEVVARAVDAGHRAGVVHRDLKPSNIALRADGTPVVLDFGLARFEQELGSSLSKSGDLFGTPSYLAPELLESAERAGVASDVYALGVALFETVTLELPFAAPTAAGLYRQVLASQAPLASEREPSAPADLDLVVATALDRDPERRYRTAADLAEDLRRLRLRQPILARPIPATLRARRWLQRNRAGAAAIFALAIALVGAVALLAARSSALRAARVSGLVAASAATLERDNQLALLLALEAVALDDKSPATISQLYEAAASSYERRPLRDPTPSSHIGSAILSPDGSRLLALGGRGVNYLYALPGGDATELPGGAAQYESGAFSPDGTRCVAVGTTRTGGGIGELWSLDGTPRLVASLQRPNGFGGALRNYRSEQCAAFARDGSLLATVEHGPFACLWDGRSGRFLTELPHDHGQRLTALAFSADGSSLYTGSAGGVVTTRDVASLRPTSLARHDAAISVLHVAGANVLTGDLTGTACFGPPLGEPRRFRLRASSVEGAAVAGAGARLLLTTSQGAHLFDASDQLGRDLGSNNLGGHDLGGHEGEVWGGSFSPSADLVLTFCTDQRVRVFGPSGRALLTLRGHRDFVTSACFSRDGSEIYSTSWDGSVRRWQLQATGFEALRAHDETMGGVAFSPDGRWLASGDRGGRVFLWDAQDLRQAPRPIDVALAKVTDLAFIGPDVLLAVGDARSAGASDSQLVAIQVPSASRLWPEPQKTKGLEARIAVRNSPSVLIAIASEARVQVFDASGAPGPTARGGRCAWFAPDGRSVLIVGQSQMRQLDLASGLETTVFETKDATFLERIAAHAETGRIAIGSVDGHVTLLDGDHRVLSTWSAHPARISSLRFSQGGTRLLSSGKGEAARLWRVADRTLVCELRGHRGFVNVAIFSPDGTRIVTAGSDGLVRLWPTEPEQAVRLAARLVFRDFTHEERDGYAELLDRR